MFTINTHSQLNTDFLIIGQGLAGSLLVMALLEQGQQVLVLDDGWASASSLAASGIINPVSGQRLSKDPQLDWLLPAARTCYESLGQRFGASLIRPKAMLRLLQSDEERTRLDQRLASPGYQGLLGPWLEPDALPPEIRAPFGACAQQQVYLVEVARLLALVRDFLRAQGLLLEEPFAAARLAFTADGLSYGPWQCRSLIFCEGHRVKSNPWFGALPWQPAKGESLLLRCNNSMPDMILSGSKGLIPLGDGHYRLGSTYEWSWDGEQPSEPARVELLAGLHNIFHQPPEVEILEQQAGIRPAAAGARPLIGCHPQYPQLKLFNGFGSRGVLLIPGYAEDFARALCTEGPLPPELTLSKHHGLLVADG